MRIGLVRRGYSNTGGAENYLKRFAAALVDSGHQCLLFASPQWPAQDWAHGEVRTVPGRSPRQFADSLQRLQPKSECDYLFSLERVWECDCFRAGDGVHRAWLQRRARYEPRWKRWARGFSGKHRDLLELEASLFTAGGAGTIIANSKLVKAEILQHSSCPSERIHVIYNGLPESAFPLPNEECPVRDLKSQGAYVVLFAGSGWERKGLQFAIQGFKRANIPNSVLLVAGRGGNPKRFAAPENVRFIGPTQGLKTILGQADAFILPTLYDPFSNACLEALAMGLPVITTAANGMSEIIRPGMDGEVLEEPSDEAAVAQAICNWSDKGKRDAARPRLRELARSYSIEANLKQTLAVLEKP